jgi:hypothetical protein
MDIRTSLERGHSKTITQKIVRFVDQDKTRFKHLVEIYLEGPYRITQRAAWPLSQCAEKHPQLIQPHLKKLLDFCLVPNVHDAVKRNTVRLLQFIDIPKKNEAKVINLCFHFLENKKEPVAVRVFAMSVLGNLSMKHPDLKNELIVLIEDQLPAGSAGFISRARKVLKQISPKN